MSLLETSLVSEAESGKLTRIDAGPDLFPEILLEIAEAHGGIDYINRKYRTQVTYQ